MYACLYVGVRVMRAFTVGGPRCAHALRVGVRVVHAFTVGVRITNAGKANLARLHV